MKLLKLLPLILLLLLGLFFRVYRISSDPPGLTWDEAALGYNAYSILKTGRDEYGTFLPLNLKSFGDYKPAVYTYLDIPFVAVFGLNETAVRLPSVLAGTLLILFIYLLTNELFKNRRLALFVAGMLTISPLAIDFSRPAFESNVALLFNVIATYLYIRGLKKPVNFLGSSLFFGLSLFTYQASRLFVPLLLLALTAVYWRQVRLDKWVKSALVVLAMVGGVLLFTMLAPGQSNRLATMNFFAYQRPASEVTELSQEDHLAVSSLQFQFLHGEWFAYVRGLAERYFIYFSPKMLFVDGDYNQRDRVPDLGLLSYLSVIFLPLGLYFLLKQKGKSSTLVLLWLLVAPIPAVLSRDLISMIRALNLTVPLTVLEGAGVYLLLEQVKNRRLYYLSAAALVFLLSLNLAVYFDRYFVHMPKEYSSYWMSGYKQAMTELNTLSREKKFNSIVVSDSYGQPYIYYLFYTKYDPSKFQKQARLDQPTVDVGTVRQIDNIQFRHIYWPSDRGSKNSLFVGTKEELPDKDILPFKDYKIMEDINFLDNQPAFRVVETK